ncbi:adenylyltransferase/cytidyltransferase family protein [Candidatus Daviesbacteria bacterium]|nr:adenylyltransferase/cytidyltransferase family protein [Candidatus Daviesbacteria bacterium]
MGEAISVGKITEVIQKLKKQHNKIVLVGGCFDILHPGHVIFLEKAKQTGDILFVFLEADMKVRQLKGVDRPIHNQKMRAKVLSVLCCVDYIVMLPFLKSDTDYDKLIAKIRPDVIAASSKDTNIAYHIRSAKLIGAKFQIVTKAIRDHSSSRILTT